MAVAPLRCLHNRGNTCWAASIVQALRALHRFVRFCNKGSLLGVALADPDLKEELVPPLFAWCRACLKNEEGSGYRQADPSELLMELFDRDDVDTSCFTNKRTTRYKCLTCHHERRVHSTEKILLLSSLPTGARPVQRAVDLEFGYLNPTTTPGTQQAPPSKIEPPPLSLNAHSPRNSGAPAVPSYPPAPPMTMSAYNSRFAGPASDPERHPLRDPATTSASEARDASASKAVFRESWWRCDDGNVTEVRLTTATPYVLFYQERDGTVDTREHESIPALKAPRAPKQAKKTLQTQELDCDKGECGGQRRRHSQCVEAYGIGEVLAIQIVFPKHMHMGRVERTLLMPSSETSDDPRGITGLKAYDLVSFVSRVGGSHYVSYRIKHRDT